MSETVHYKGKLKEIKLLLTETLESKCKEILKNHGVIALKSDYNTFQDCLIDEFYQQYIVCNQKLYEIIEKRQVLEDDMFLINNITNEIYDFELRYYSDEMDFFDAINEALKNHGN